MEYGVEVVIETPLGPVGVTLDGETCEAVCSGDAEAAAEPGVEAPLVSADVDAVGEAGDSVCTGVVQIDGGADAAGPMPPSPDGVEVLSFVS